MHSRVFLAVQYKDGRPTLFDIIDRAAFKKEFPIFPDPFRMDDRDARMLELESSNHQLEQGLMMARAQIESSEMELRAVQIAYANLKKMWDKVMTRIEAIDVSIDAN